MNPLESRLTYPFGDTLPEPGHVRDVVPGLRWLRMPLPFALDHVNLWLLRDRVDGREGWTVIDCGIARDDLKALWQQVFDHGLEGLPILRVLVTHMHPDHVGLADWLCKTWNAPLMMTMADYAMAKVLSGRMHAQFGEQIATHFARHGIVDAEAQEKLRQRGGYFAELVPAVPDSMMRLMDGESVRIGDQDWEVITGFGHSPEHAALYDRSRNILIAGDMVLPRISTNVGVFDHEPEGDPLRQYLSSLRKFLPLPEDALVLPSHGRPFHGLHERIRQQEDHHAARLEEVRQACAQPRSAADIVPIMFPRKLDLHQLTFALGEALAHLHLLYYRGELRRVTGDNGIVRFVAAEVAGAPDVLAVPT